MPRKPKQPGVTEAEHAAAVGIKITSIGITYGRKVNLGNYEAANLECSVWADVTGESDENLPDTMAKLWALAKGDVLSQPEVGQSVALSTPAVREAPKRPAPQPEEPQDRRTPADPAPGGTAGAGPVAPLPAPVATGAESPGVQAAGPGRELTKRIVSFGTPKVTAGIDADTFGKLLALTPDLERICGKGSAMTELADMCPGAFVVHAGEKRYSRLALTQEEGERLLLHFRTVVAAVQKGAK